MQNAFSTVGFIKYVILGVTHNLTPFLYRYTGFVFLKLYAVFVTLYLISGNHGITHTF